MLPTGGPSTCPFAASFLNSTGDFFGTLGDCLPNSGLDGFGGFVGGVGGGGLLLPLPLTIPPVSTGDPLQKATKKVAGYQVGQTKYLFGFTCHWHCFDLVFLRIHQLLNYQHLN